MRIYKHERAWPRATSDESSAQKLVRISPGDERANRSGRLEAATQPKAARAPNVGCNAWLSHCQPLIERIIAQNERRISAGEPVPAGDKLISLFEPNADIIDHRPERLDPHPMITPSSTVERVAPGRLVGCAHTGPGGAVNDAAAL